MTPHILFDLSRLLWQAERSVPSGIERVEFAYARHLLAGAPERVDFAALAWRRFGPVPRDRATALIAARAAQWSGSDPAADARAAREVRAIRRSVLLTGERSLYRRLRESEGPPVYLLVSHHHLDRPALIARLKARSGARFVCLVHDLIPMLYPEYARPGHDARHALRMDTVARLADGVIVNSAATDAALAPLLARSGRAVPVVVAPLGIDLAAPRDDAAPPPAPYFVSVGTIEPRKNHLLLLNLWRDLANELGPRAPRLILIGRRGWENENVVDMIERCIALRGLVEEQNALSDARTARLLAGARALLLPSFAEGYGLPLAEALAMGVPALCSDLPALREVGGEVPEYLHPLDGLGWRRAILDYAAPGSARRQRQSARLAAWRPPPWDAHFAKVDALLDAVARADAA
jgi:glycosyltransferase involved in cell wall biosynthesis